MNSQQLGAHFEILTKDFFVTLLESLGFQITKERIQFNGNQHGFDILIIVSKNYIEHKIFIECKNYSNDLAIGNILKKAWDLEKSYELNQNDLFIAMNSKSNFKNEDNSEKSSPIFNEKFPFTSYFLDVSNGIKSLFAVNNDFYKALYGHNVDFEVDRVKEIDRFKSIILSRKPFHKPSFTAKNKSNFIGVHVLSENYVARTFKEESDKALFNLFDDNKSATLPEIITSNDKIFVLGNPGSGKSTELRNLSEKLWEEGRDTGLIPIYRSLRNFTNSDSLESYLPISIEKYNDIILILDGIDEIADIEYFKSRLEVFIAKNENQNKSIKYVISCRTNVYESIVNTISNFNAFYLNDLTRYEIRILLKSNCGELIDKLNFGERLTDFLNTPFQVLMLSEYINANRKLPNNTVELWENYINVRLSNDELDKLKKISLNTHLIIEYSKKLSLVNELMKSNVCRESNIFKIVNKNYIDFKGFKKNPLLDCLSGTKNWFFEHRNIQEYFAALTISEKSFEEIMRFVKVDGTMKTHQSLFNTITFLINLLEKGSEKYIKLRDWLVLNEPELLFKADYERVSENIREIVFRKYFDEQCLKKTHWISTNRTFEIAEIAKFGNTSSNFAYLIDIVNDRSNHRRAIISALDLLSYFDIPKEQVNITKLMLIKFLEDTKEEPAIKAQVLSLIESQKFAYEDSGYLTEIFRIFEKETNKEINRRLLSLINILEDIDKFSDYIEAEFLRDKKIILREDIDNTLRGNSYILRELIFKLKSSDKFLSITKYFFDINYIIGIEADFEEPLLTKLTYFIKKEEDFIFRFLSIIKDKLTFHTHDKLLKELIEKSGKEKIIVQFLLNSYPFEEIDFFLSNIVNDETVKQVKKYLIDNHISNEIAERFRNYIGNMNSKELAIDFQDSLESEGFKFTRKVSSQKEVLKWQDEVRSKTQEGFDLLFDKPSLLIELEKIFIRNGNEFDLYKFQKINMAWYEENGHGSIISPILSLIDRVIRFNRDESLHFDKMESFLQNDFLIFKQIKTVLQNNKNAYWKFKISQEQTLKIIEWCRKSSEEIDFQKVLKLYDDRSFSYGRDYDKLKMILFYFDYFDFKLPLDFLLKCIKFYDIESTGDSESFNQFKIRVGDDEAFKNQVIENIKSDEFSEIVLYKHIDYSIDHEIIEVFPDLIEYFKRDISIFNEDKKIERFIRIYASIYSSVEAEDVLKDFCSNIESRICWKAIKIILKSYLDKSFCIDKSLEYLKSGNDRYLPEALEVLFVCNQDIAIDFFIKFIEDEPASNIRFISFGNYDKIKEYGVLKKLYSICHNTNNDGYDSHLLRGFFGSYISNISKSFDGYERTQNELNKIKHKLENDGSDLFYINILIENSTKSYINYKSKPYNFVEALDRVNEIFD